MSKKARLLLVVLALATTSVALSGQTAVATSPLPAPPGEVIGPFGTLEECNDSLKNTTVPHSGCYQCGWVPTRYCYRVYPPA